MEKSSLELIMLALWLWDYIFTLRYNNVKRSVDAALSMSIYAMCRVAAGARSVGQRCARESIRVGSEGGVYQLSSMTTAHECVFALWSLNDLKVLV